MPEGNAVRAMFGGIARRYDAANHILSGGIDFLWRRALTRRVRRARPARVVDLATGSGDVAFALRDRLGESVDVTGMDFCEPMLEIARRKRARKPRWASIAFESGDCMSLPLADGAVDAATIAFGVRNFEDRQRGLREIRRVLRPGGRLFVLEFSQPVPWFRPLYYRYLKRVLPSLARWTTGDRAAYDYLAGSIEEFPARDELSAQLREAGFAEVRARGLTFSVVALHEAVT